MYPKMVPFKNATHRTKSRPSYGYIDGKLKKLWLLEYEHKNMKKKCLFLKT